jgi:Lrp/AsnC family transcriptional regulator, leucine-responsive regulatory protein
VQNDPVALDSKDIDEIDLVIIGELRRDARISWRQLADRVHLSPTSVADRVRRLEAAGVLRSYTAVVDQAALGRDVRAVIDVSLPPTMTPEDFEERLAGRDEIAFAAFVTGSADYTVVADCAGAEGLDLLIRWLKVQGGAATTVSKVVLRPVIG